MKKIACVFPIFLVGEEFNPHRLKAWKKQFKFKSSISEPFSLIMNSNDSQREKLKEILSESTLICSHTPYCSIHARYLLAKYVKSLGYEIIYVTDDDEYFDRFDNFQQLLSGYSLKSYEEIESILHSEIIGLKDKRVAKTRCVKGSYKYENSVTSGSFIPDDHFFKIDSNDVIRQTDERYSRMQRGYLFKVDDFIWIIENSVEFLKIKGEYTSKYYTFDDSLFSYVSYHALGMTTRFFKPDEDLFDSSMYRGGSQSTCSTPESVNGKSYSLSGEELKEFSESLHSKFNNMKNKSIEDLVYEL